MSEENNNQEELTNQKSGASQGAQQATQKTKEKLIKRIANSIKSGAAKQSLLAAIGPILLWAFVIIVILIIIIGIAMFLVTMPGMVMEKLKALSKAVGNYVSAFFGADTTQQIDEIEVYGTLDYLEQMGWDLKGEGFLTDYMIESDVSEVKENLEDSSSATLDKKTGVVRDENDKILKANSDFIFKYLISDNYVYTIKNNNLATRGEAEGFFQNLFGIITTGIYKIRNFLFGPIYDSLGINEALYGRFGVGLIAIREEDGSIGAEGKLVNTGTIWNWDSIKINTDNKTLSIAKNSILSTLKAAVSGQDLFNNPMEFNLDGWTGRYGMPLEFLLAIHKATMMPDLAYDMVETFGTEVNVLLHDINGSAIATYKGADGYIGFDKLNKALNNMEGSNFFSSVISWFDNLSISQKEAQIAFKLGVEHSPDCTCEKGTIEVYTYNGKPVRQDGDKFYYIDGEEEKEVSKNDLEVSATQSDEYVTICSACENYIQTLMSILQSNTNYDYQAYAPYISSVKDHWYRDVYFVINKNNLNFVDYDYDYEIMTGERWTLYETYTSNPADGDLYNPEKEGDFVYYKLNDDGSTGDEYEGKVVEGEVEYVKGEKSETLRIASIGEDGIKVVKKAVTFSASNEDKLLDLGWNKNSSGIWSAYEETDDETSTMDPLFPDVEDDGTYESIIKKNCYMNLTTSGNIVQTGEGQRTETNNDIKKMFLQNNYFRYDGTNSTAEIITALREKIYGSSKDRYGPISSDILDKEYDLSFDDAKYTSKLQNGTYKVKDYVGNVTLNQDSLNAFTMLENTHTLDADYIYRDFKELIVELGYFKKEELTDETPKLLQWIVPDIGSGGYPDRSLDKRENEFGTMVHSKSDIDINRKHLIQTLIEEGAEREDTDAPDKEKDNALKPIEGIKSNGNNASNNNFLSETPISRLTSVGAITHVDPADVKEEDPPSGADSKHKVDYIFNGIRYEGWAQTKSTCTLNAFAFMAAAYEGNSNEYYLTDSSGRFCSLGTGVSNAYWNDSSYFQGFGTVDIPGTTYTTADTALEEAIAEAFSKSIPVYFFSGFKSSHGNHAVTLLGCDSSGKILYYNPGSGVIESYGDKMSFEENLHDLISNGVYQSGGTFYNAYIPDEPPDGAKSSSTENPYVGYEGNEAVVSPVTGILLDYGTYEKNTTQEPQPENPTPDGETPEKVTTEDPRVNVDLKYGFPNIYENNAETGEEGETPDGGTIPSGNNEEFESQIVSDKVGYAKILVLDAENYQKLEGATSNQWKTNSLVRVDQTTVELGDTDQVTSNRVSFREALTGENPNKDEDYSKVYEDWSMVDKTIYGYKEFAETYEKYGIAGYVVYIDGFKCELPDDSLSGGESEGGNESGDSVSSQIPNGKPLTMESFKQTETQINSEQSEEDEESLIQTKYESDEAYKLASEKATNKLAAEVDLKTQAAASISINDNGNDLIFIKEGTVIGRTLTDKELLESPDFRNGEYGTYEELRGEMEESEGSGEGEKEENNLKLIGNYLRIIMKDENGTTVENVEDYMKLDDSGNTNSGDAQPYQAQEGDDVLLANMMHLEGCTNGFEGMGYSKEDADKINMMTGYVLLNRAIVNYGNHGTTIREQLLAPGQYSTAYAAQNQSILCMDCYENAKLCLKYDCNYVKNPEGKEMTHDVLGQSGWDQCPDHSVLGKNCFWWVDDDFDGIADEYYEGCKHFDEFFCYNSQYEGM